MRLAPALPLLAALLLAGCVGPSSHAAPSERWLLPESGRASAPLHAVAEGAGPLLIAVYGDCRGGRAAHREVVAAIRAERPDLVIFTGDGVDCYPTGHMPDLGPAGYLVPLWPQYLRGYPAFSLMSLVPFPQLMHEFLFCLHHTVRDPDGWDGFLEDTAPLRLEDRVPFLFVPGNHDLYHRFDREQVAAFFGDPEGPGGRDPDALWFSRDVAGLRLLILDSGADLPGAGEPLEPGGEQWRWLEGELARARDAGLVPVVALHIPPFSSGAEDVPPPFLAERFVPEVLDPADVPLVLSGHCHAYERIERTRTDGGKTTFVVTGGGGSPFHRRLPLAERPAGSARWAGDVYHYVILSVEGKRIAGRVVDVPSGEIIDAWDDRARHFPTTPP